MAPATTNSTGRLPLALAYAAHGWQIFPCHVPTEQGCSCRRDCGRIGKHPRTLHGLKDATTDETTIRRWWKQWPQANIAVATGAVSGLVVLDEDTYKGGDISRIALEHQHGPLPETVQQLTGGGGVQFFFAHPGPPVKNGVETLGAGLDIRGDGGYVILPPSLHASGKDYAWELSHDWEDTPLVPMPPWLLTLCHDRPTQEVVDAGAPIPSGQRNHRLFQLGCSLRARGMSHVVILAALGTLNATQCQPPLDEVEVQIIAKSCAGYAPGILPPGPSMNGAALSANVPEVTADHDAWRQDLVLTKAGKPTESFQTLTLLLGHTAPWDTALWYDTIRELAMVGEARLDDYLVSEAAVALERQWRVPIRTPRLVQRALEYLCHAHPRDLLQEWLHALPPWDGVERLPCWLSDHAGAPRTAYGMAVSRLLPVSLVARALHPGCQYRNVVILEGDENIGKSKLVKALASPAWYREVSHGFDGKEGHMILSGAWVVELAEMSSYTRTEEARLKAFITMERDEFIPKYSNLPVARPRRAVFIMTVNPEGDMTYLRGQTGNTRYLPVTVQDIHPEDVELIREQLFSEALAYYAAHPMDWWTVSEDATAETRAVLEARRQTNIYEQRLAVWVDGRTHGVTADEIFEGFLQLDAKEKWKDMALQKQIAGAMRALGWTSQPEKNKQADGTWKSVRRWRPPGYRTLVSTAIDGVSTGVKNDV